MRLFNSHGAKFRKGISVGQSISLQKYSTTCENDATVNIETRNSSRFMARKFFPIIVMLIAACAFCLVSCGNDDDEVNNEVKNEVTDNPNAVDLGVSVKWAKCNLGASKPEEYGNYYGWGCLVPYSIGSDNADNQLYFEKIGGSGVKSSDSGTSADPMKDYVLSGKSIAGTEWDVARKDLGGKWRMPTKNEIKELIDNCSWTWTTENGIQGVKIANKNDASKYIFFPASGYYKRNNMSNAGNVSCCWTADPTQEPAAAYIFGYGKGMSDFGAQNRYIGAPIRPVID